MKANIVLAGAASDLVNELQKERGMSGLCLTRGWTKVPSMASADRAIRFLAPFRAALELGRIGQESKQTQSQGRT